MTIFLSYRRDDSADVSGRIYDRLVDHFGPDVVFKDVDDIPLGIDFKDYLEQAVRSCDAQLVVIGPNWLTASDGAGQRRIDDPADWVRIEVEAALTRNVPVIPLLVGGAIMPKADVLPASLAKLAYRNGIPIRPDPDFHRDMNRLIASLVDLPGSKVKQPASKPAHVEKSPVSPVRDDSQRHKQIQNLSNLAHILSHWLTIPLALIFNWFMAVGWVAAYIIAGRALKTPAVVGDEAYRQKAQQARKRARAFLIIWVVLWAVMLCIVILSTLLSEGFRY